VAAKECAYQIRKFLSKDNSSRAYVQYNAVMLIRILSDNPGSTFTKNIDKKFVDAVKELSRTSRDPSVQQLLSDTLNNFLRDKESDVNMAGLLEMWKKEKVKIEKVLAQGVTKIDFLRINILESHCVLTGVRVNRAALHG
jgi:hypothetical protein